MKSTQTIFRARSSTNDFDREELNRWWSHQNICWWCGRWHADAFHHIFGRLGEHNNSILNAAPLGNQECHIAIHGRLGLNRNRQFLVGKTIEFLLSQGYELTQNDIGFIDMHRAHYKGVL